MIIFNALQTGLNGGIGRYSYELAKELYNISNENLKIIIREQEKDKFSFAKESDLIKIKGINTSKDRNIYEQLKLPKLINRNYKNCIFHNPDSILPRGLKCKSIITIHDLAFKSIKKDFSRKSRIWKDISVKYALKKADKIICITNFSKKEIENYFGDKYSSKISVVYNGFNNFSNEEIVIKNVSENIKQVIREKYIFTVSTISPRKNIHMLVKAFNLIKNNTEHNLVIAGGFGYKSDYITKTIKLLNLEDRVICTGRINDDELKILYKNMDLFVYISLYEGFGLPPLEALSYKKQCIVSDIDPFSEILMNSCVKVNPKDEKEISEEILFQLSNKVDKINFDILNNFSWSKCAINIWNFYNHIGG